jgi:hypothetical protein
MHTGVIIADIIETGAFNEIQEKASNYRGKRLVILKKNTIKQ